MTRISILSTYDVSPNSHTHKHIEKNPMDQGTFRVGYAEDLGCGL